MSTSALYHTFSLSNLQHLGSTEDQNSVTLKARTLKRTHQCSSCNSRKIIYKGTKQKRLLLPRIGSKKCILEVEIPRLKCKKCKSIRWLKLPFVDGKKRVTKAFAQFALELLQFGTVKHVANFLGVSWDTIKEIHKQHLKKSYQKIPYHELRYLSVDEISLQKGHNYMTIVSDIETGRIIYAVEGRSSADISPFLKRLRKKARHLKAIAIDMSNAYIKAARQHLPGIDIVFDHFHVTALINKALDELRKEEFEMHQKAGYQTLKGNRFLLLRNYENLDPAKSKGLEHLLKMNNRLAKGYILKEQFRMFWLKNHRKMAVRFFASGF
jgi:transposase